MEPGKVVALHLKPSPGQLQPVSELKAVASKGLEGDRCFGQAHRQVLFVALSEIDDLGYKPGDLREQLTVELPGLQALPPGAQIQVGDAVFEIEGNCAPCNGMANRLGEDPNEFKAKTERRRGMLAHVMGDGIVRVGDEVRVISG
jgi:MOSC domain-containing protein YiiM